MQSRKELGENGMAQIPRLRPMFCRFFLEQNWQGSSRGSPLPIIAPEDASRVVHSIYRMTSDSGGFSINRASKSGDGEPLHQIAPIPSLKDGTSNIEKTIKLPK